MYLFGMVFWKQGGFGSKLKIENATNLDSCAIIRAAFQPTLTISVLKMQPNFVLP